MYSLDRQDWTNTCGPRKEMKSHGNQSLVMGDRMPWNGGARLCGPHYSLHTMGTCAWRPVTGWKERVPGVSRGHQSLWRCRFLNRQTMWRQSHRKWISPALARAGDTEEKADLLNKLRLRCDGVWWGVTVDLGWPQGRVTGKTSGPDEMWGRRKKVKTVQIWQLQKRKVRMMEVGDGEESFHC